MKFYYNEEEILNSPQAAPYLAVKKFRGEIHNLYERNIMSNRIEGQIYPWAFLMEGLYVTSRLLAEFQKGDSLTDPNIPDDFFEMLAEFSAIYKRIDEVTLKHQRQMEIVEKMSSR